MRQFLGLILCICAAFATMNVQAQMIIDNTQTPTQLVQDVLLGQGVVVSNITYTGDPMQIGYFNAANAVFPISEGIVMASGDVNDIPATGGTFASTIVGVGGDADLDVVSSAGTNDAVVLEFDFVPTGDSIKFDYIFGSEEYPEFVNAGFNDVFVFIISGPGFAGPFANGGENIALIPGTVTPVTIDNVNDGLNSQYYVDNTSGGANGVVYDGYTVTLTALAAVTCGEEYHLKFAIADAGDSSFDSGVFLEARSFNSNAVEVNISTISGDSAIVEGCTSATIDFRRPSADTLYLIDVYTSGNAINGVDYTGLPSVISFGPGDSVVTVTVEALEDGVFEPTRDTLIITVFSLNLCGDTIESSGMIFIQEDYNLTIQTEDVNVVCPTDSVMLTASAGGGNPDYTYTWSNGDVGDTIWVPSTSSMSYTVDAEDLCAATSPTQTVNVSVNIPDDPEVTITGPTTFDCVPETVLLTAAGSNGTPPFSYLWSNGSNANSISVSLSTDSAFSVVITDACGTESAPDIHLIAQNPVAVPQIQTSLDVTLDCPGDQATLTAIASGGNPPYNYIWSNSAVSSTITVSPTQTTDYIITVTDNCFIGSVQDTITVTVEPYTSPVVSVNDTAILCPGDLAMLSSALTGGNDPFTYSWTDGSGQPSTTVNPMSSVDLILTVTDDCGESTSDTSSIDVPVYDPLMLNVINTDLLSSDTVSICELWADTLYSATFGGLAPYAYTWSGTLIEGIYVNADSAIMTVNYELPPDSSVVGLYSLNVIDQCGEEVTNEFYVEVISCDIIQPNVFNPNSPFTGGNDFCGVVPQNNVFNLPCLELYPGNTMYIFDRWGRKCFESENYHLNPWDGGNQSSGTYFYVCELPGDKEAVKGYFQLIR